MTICARCHRPLSRQPTFVAGMAMGPKCAAAVAGSRPRRARSIPVQPDARQQDLFTEAAS